MSKKSLRGLGGSSECDLLEMVYVQNLEALD